EMVQKLVEEGAVNKKEAEELVDDMLAKANKQREAIKSKVKEELRNEIEKAGISKTEDVEELKQKIDKLELHVKSLERELNELKDQSIEETDSDS
ncbi:MAG: hypothetical protein ACQERJ_04140, partial [Bacillota bacterium]